MTMGDASAPWWAPAPAARTLGSPSAPPPAAVVAVAAAAAAAGLWGDLPGDEAAAFVLPPEAVAEDSTSAVPSSPSAVPSVVLPPEAVAEDSRIAAAAPSSARDLGSGSAGRAASSSARRGSCHRTTTQRQSEVISACNQRSSREGNPATGP